MIFLSATASVLTLIGLWLVGNKDKDGFIVSISANFCWVAWGREQGPDALPLIFLNLAIVLLNLRSLYLWGLPQRGVMAVEEPVQDSAADAFRALNRLRSKGTVALPSEAYDGYEEFWAQIKDNQFHRALLARLRDLQRQHNGKIPLPPVG